MAQLKIKLVKSTIGCPQDQKDTVRALGLRKLQSTVVKEDNAPVSYTHLARQEGV